MISIRPNLISDSIEMCTALGDISLDSNSLINWCDGDLCAEKQTWNWAELRWSHRYAVIMLGCSCRWRKINGLDGALAWSGAFIGTTRVTREKIETRNSYYQLLIRILFASETSKLLSQIQFAGRRWNPCGRQDEGGLSYATARRIK